VRGQPTAVPGVRVQRYDPTSSPALLAGGTGPSLHSSLELAAAAGVLVAPPTSARVALQSVLAALAASDFGGGSPDGGGSFDDAIAGGRSAKPSRETVHRLVATAPLVAGVPAKSSTGPLGLCSLRSEAARAAGELECARSRLLLDVAAAHVAEPAGVGAARLCTAARSSAAGVVASPGALSAADVNVALRLVENAKRAWVEHEAAVRAAEARARDAELEQLGIF
jgi:hypothetical protein